MRGTIKQRAKGSWTIILDVGRDPGTGKRKQQWLTVRGTKRDAERKLAEVQVSMDTGTYITPAKITVGEFLQRWLKDYALTNVRPRTYEGYQMILEAHLIPALGGIPLPKLQPAKIQEYYATALKEGRRDGRGGLSARSVQHHHRLLSQALARAVNWGLLVRNLAEAVDPPKPVNKEMSTLDEDSLDAFLDAAEETPFYHLFHLAAYTGLRRSELLGLRWKDVNLNLGTLSVTQVMHRLRDGTVVFQEPKTAKSRRQVSLSPETVITLRNHKVHQEQQARTFGMDLVTDRLVFLKVDGAPLSPITVNHAFARILRKAGLEGIRLHDLRHTRASLMMERGVYPKVVQERLGHSSIAVTMDVCSHLLPGMQEAAALAFDEGLKRRTG